MSKCRPKNQQLIDDITKAVRKEFSYTYTGLVGVNYDASEYSKRDYVIKMYVGEVWGAIDTEYLRKLIRANGGTNIIGGCRKIQYSRRYKFIEMAFDEKIRK